MITPKEAFEAAKVLWPGVSHVYKRSDMTSMLCQNGRVSLVIDAEVDWGNSTKYPPPPPEEWRDAVFPSDVGKPGRLGTHGCAWSSWYPGVICGKSEAGWINEKGETFMWAQVRKSK